MLKVVLAAIAWLHPSLALETRQNYAEIIATASAKYEIDPLLVVAIIHRETGGTWRNRSRSDKSDHGLMQIRVSLSSSTAFLGREERLLDPKTNIYRGVYLLSHYRDLHTRCKSEHPYWIHFQWGTRVPRRLSGWVDRVTPLYETLVRRFIMEGEV